MNRPENLHNYTGGVFIISTKKKEQSESKLLASCLQVNKIKNHKSYSAPDSLTFKNRESYI
jgi:hypothetical protein